MRFLLIILLFGAAPYSFATKIPEGDIIGSYKQLLVLDDGVWAVIGLGMMLRGTWYLEGDVVTFSTKKEQLFRVYGRKLHEPEYPYKIGFIGFRKREVWINLNPKKNKSVKHLYQKHTFGAEPQGLSMHVQKKPIKSILIAQKEDAVPLEPEYTTFLYNNLQGYNDFLVLMPPPVMVNSQTFQARFADGKLTFFSDSFMGARQEMRRGPLPEDDELSTLDHFAWNGLFPERLLYVDSVVEYGKTLLSQDFYPYVESPTVDNTQDYVELKPVIDLEVIAEKKGYLISAKCDGHLAAKECYELK